MKKLYALLICGSIFLATSCGTMFKSWKAIPPPGGCDQCHNVPISENWQVAYSAPNLNDERGRLYFQTEQYNMPPRPRPASPLDTRKLEDMPCFDCHRAPTPSHRGRIGRYHH